MTAPDNSPFNLPPATPPTEPLPSLGTPPPAKANSRRLLLGILGVLALGCGAVGAFAAFDIQARQRQYDAGHTAYLAGDCDAAVAAFNQVGGIDEESDMDVVVLARAERSECNDFIEARDQGEIGDRIARFGTFLDKYPSSPIEPTLRRAVEADFDGIGGIDLAVPDFCADFDGLNDKGLILDSEVLLPEIVFECANLAASEQDYASAILLFDRFRRDYPDNVLADQVEVALAEAAIADATASGAGFLPAPQSTGGSSGSGDTATIIIQNDTPEALSLVFSGPDVRVENLEVCTECEDFETEPVGCPELGPVGRYVVTPGSYDVVVRASSDGQVTPFRGQWEIGPGEEYYSCFFLVTSSE